MTETAEIFARAVIVTRPGRCPFCRRYFKVGQDLIVRVPRRGWMHEGCASAVLQFAPEEPAAPATLSIELRLPGDIDEVTEEILRDELAPVFVSAERDEKGLRARFEVPTEDPDRGPFKQLAELLEQLDRALYPVGPVEQVVVGVRKSE